MAWTRPIWQYCNYHIIMWHFLTVTPIVVLALALLLTTTPHHNRFTALFPGPLGWAGARRELLDFMVQGKINRDRHTDHPAGRHSIRTNQYPPSPSSFFTGRMLFLSPNQQCQSTECIATLATLKITDWLIDWLIEVHSSYIKLQTTVYVIFTGVSLNHSKTLKETMWYTLASTRHIQFVYNIGDILSDPFQKHIDNIPRKGWHDLHHVLHPLPR